MDKRDEPLLIVAVIAAAVWLYSKSRIGGISPLGGPQLGARVSPSGTLVNVPGVGGFSTGPAGTSVVIDPRLFGGLLGTSSGAGAFNPGSGVTSPLLPQVGGALAGGVAGTLAGSVGDPGTTQPDGTQIGLPLPVIPPETPTQVPVDPGSVDPTTIDPSMLIPSIMPDPSTMDPGAIPQVFDASTIMAI